MKHTLLHIYRSLWITAVIILLILALILTAARLTTPYLANQRPEIEQLVSSFLKQPVEIGTLTVHWHNFVPVLTSTHILIYDDAKTHPLLKLDSFELKINVLDSFLNRRLAIDSLTISGAKIAAQQNSDNTITVKGIGTFNPNSSGDDFKVFLEWLLTAPHLTIQNISLDWKNKNGVVIPLRDLAIRFKNTALQHSIMGEVQARLDQTVPTQLEFIVLFSGDWQNLNTISAKFYLSGQKVLLAQWLGQYPLQNLQIQNGLADFQAWGNWQQNQLQKFQTVFNLSNLQLLKQNSSNPILINTAKGNFLWQVKNNNWTIDTQLNNLDFPRWQKIPGIKNLNAFIHTTATDGFAKLKGSNTILDFGPLFRRPLVLQKLNSDLQWQNQPDGWVIQSNNTTAHTTDTDAIGKLSLLLPSDNSSPVINLIANMEMIGRQHLADYLPIGILSHGLVDWLNTSIESVDKTDTTLVLRGPLSSYPFDQNDGIFIVDSQINNLNLNYFPGWPRAIKVNGNLVFRDRSMQMNIDSGQINNTSIKNITAAIPMIEKNVLAVLQIDGTVKPDLSDVFKFLTESPLHKTAFSGLENFQGSGPSQLDLHLVIPLEHTKIETTVKGQMQFQNNNLKAHSLEFQNLLGSLDFTRNSFNSNNIKAELWKKPINISVATANANPLIKFNYQDLVGSLLPQNNLWRLNLESPALKGQITIPTEKTAPIEANFQRLNIIPGSTDTFAQIDPTDIPKIILTANDVRYGNKQFGQVQLTLSPINNGLQINNLTVTSTAFNLTATGSWQLVRSGEITQLDGTMSSNDLAATLASWDLPSSITAKQTTVQFNLHWPGAAYEPDLGNLNGKLTLQMQNGQIDVGSDTERKMDIGRLLSLLSLDTITRRLRLDFSDVTKKGFPFDTIKGDFQMVRGNAYTLNTMIIGPLANVGMAGRIGLGAEDYDLMLNVTPKIGGSLPTIVGLATSPLAPVAGLALGPIGPAVGVGAWVASKFVGSAVDKMATDTYHMTGSWGSPQIKHVGNYFSSKNKTKDSKQ